MTPWILHQDLDERWLTCPALSALGLLHAFSLRPAVRAAPDRSRATLSRLAKGLGLEPGSITVPRQVHGATVAVPGPGGNAVPEEADAVLLHRSIGSAAVATADCVGAILLEPRSGTVAVVHAGWRGTLAGALGAALDAVSASTGSAPGDLLLAMGPAIRGCCYEVGEEVASPFRKVLPEASSPEVYARGDGRRTVDLVEANRALGLRAGLSPERIHDAGLCTACRPDLCWSHRAERGAAGRMWTLAGATRFGGA